MADIAERLKKFRKNAGISQAEMAKRVGISRGAYSLYETGARNPKVETIEKFAHALGIEFFDLVDYDNEENEKISDEHIMRAPWDSPYEAESSADLLKEILFDMNHDGIQKVIEYALDLSENPKYKQEFPFKQK